MHMSPPCAVNTFVYLHDTPQCSCWIKVSTANPGCDPFTQNFRKFRSKTEWIGSVQPERFRKSWSTFRGGPLFCLHLALIQATVTQDPAF